MAKSSSSKKSTRKRVDRISGLPNDLLYRILAFLPTRLAMATSLLSRRWQYVWKGVPALNFFNDDADYIVEDFTSTEALEQYRSLKYFISRALFQNRAPCLERVDFFVLPVINEHDPEVWLKELSRRSIKEVNLFYDQCYSPPITCLLDGVVAKHLVALKLHYMDEFYLSFNFSSTPCLPRLEILHFTNVAFTDNGELSNFLFSGCPRLRELVTCGRYSDMNFNCSTLKILKILDGVTDCIIGIPNLEYLKIVGDATWADLFHKLQHVIKLNVSLGQFLDIDQYIDQDATTMHFNLPFFSRLKILELGCYEEHSVLQTRMLLRHMPNCVTLIIHMMSPWEVTVHELKGWPEVDSLGLGLHIEYIEINGFGRTKLEGVELLINLLVYCTGLKEMKLRLLKHLSSGEKNKMKNKMQITLNRLPRPAGCKIMIR